MYRLLIVDDEPIIVKGLTMMFENAKIDELMIYKAYSAREALSVMEDIPIDILFTDIHMPGMDGLQLGEIVKEKFQDCKIIFLTGYEEFDYIYKAISKIKAKYILKSEEDEVILSELELTLIEIGKAKEKVDLDKLQNTYSDRISEEPCKDLLIMKIETYIKENVGDEITLTKLASIVHMNPSYLSRYYKKETGNMLSDFIKNVKIEKSKELLMNTNQKIGDIASELGFDSPSYFCKLFKNSIGVSPIEYRTRSK